ncbi:DUF202 domain-containing protein [Microbacterium sp. Mu-80]|uniref:DUF202 domain-containing protein n=1 Tax=Microbacterium bandirmense TaxID=3122050 RepID=A0ABU8LDL9_9MICO
MKSRFPRSLYSEGSEPDPRFSLANERTFLAWVRTSLALIAAGVALEALQVPISPEFRLTSALVFVALGVVAAIQAWAGWWRTEQAMRRNEALPGLSTGLGISLGVLLGVGFIVLGVFL